jgi:glyoxylase-like metal-dependent hydrolase (beta-lactamase superfamily II)
MDHIGACPYIEENSNATISVHVADAQYVQEPITQFMSFYQDIGPTPERYQNFLKQIGGRGVRVTNPLHDGDIVNVGSKQLEILHTPGHSPGSICIRETESKTLFTGDALVPQHWHRTMLGIYCYPIQYLQSLNQLSKLDIETLCPGHEPILRGSEIRDEFTFHFERYNKLETTILEIISESTGVTLWELFFKLSSRILGPGDYQPGIGDIATIRGFLNKLCFEEKIIIENGVKWNEIRRHLSQI